MAKIGVSDSPFYNSCTAHIDANFFTIARLQVSVDNAQPVKVVHSCKSNR